MVKSVGFVGWRGMVGSVLLQRMREENDLKFFDLVFFSTSNVGGLAPDGSVLEDAYDISVLKKLSVIVTTQGNAYTVRVLAKLRSAGWDGFWVDAASTLRKSDDTVLVLDPVNRDVIDVALFGGVRNFVGANCTVSGLLMGFGGLFAAGLVEGLQVVTYQAASGGGAKHMRELLVQFGDLYGEVADLLKDSGANILDIDEAVLGKQLGGGLDVSEFGVPLAGSLIPWIDEDLGFGVSKEEWKGGFELNKILGFSGEEQVLVDSLCVRVGVLRCHSQAVTFKLKDNLGLGEIESLVADHNPWVKVVPNTKVDSVRGLSPVAVSGGLGVAVGRLRKLSWGDNFVGGFTVADQLLWGAAEPLRRVLLILLGV